MNRSRYFNYIEEKLQVLAYRISQRGKLNILDLNIYSETFFADLFNIVFSFELKNMNVYKQNIEGIDLVDNKNKTIVQVSSTSTKQKIESSLSKNIFKRYVGYRFIFISIAKDATNLRGHSYVNPHGASFSPKDDIVDVGTILNIVLNMSIDKQKEFYDFIKKELGSEIDIFRVDTNLATIINILASENLNGSIDSPEINIFEISRKIEFNDLKTVKDTIDDYKIYYNKLDEKYSEFDREGANKSLSVFQIIRKQYSLLQNEERTSRDVFFSIIDNIIEVIINSKNYIEIPYEELEMCVYILVVDAFIRCKIFKNPEGYNHVITR
jgi:hypothetical protein